VILNIIALVISIILSWHYIKGGTIPGCDGSGACSEVLSSKWSAIGGMLPVSGLAMGAYLTMLIAIFYTGPDAEVQVSRLAWTVLLILAGAIFGIAIWFTIVQKWIIGEFCPYCMTEHTIGALTAVIIIRQAIENRVQQKTNTTTRSLKIIPLVTGGLLIAGIIAISQIILAPKAVYQEGTTQQAALPEVSFTEGPIVGSKTAPYLIKVLFDYNCPHCRKLHGMFDDIISRYKSKIAFILCPAPLSTQCNQYIPFDVDAYKSSCNLAKIGMAVWLADHKAFADYDKWIFAADNGFDWQPRTQEEAEEKAIQLIGADKFNAALASPWVEQYIHTTVKLYGQTVQTGNGGVPKLMFGEHWITPEITTPEELLGIMQQGLELPAP